MPKENKVNGDTEKYLQFHYFQRAKSAVREDNEMAENQIINTKCKLNNYAASVKHKSGRLHLRKCKCKLRNANYAHFDWAQSQPEVIKIHLSSYSSINKIMMLLKNSFCWFL